MAENSTREIVNGDIIAAEWKSERGLLRVTFSLVFPPLLLSRCVPSYFVFPTERLVQARTLGLICVECAHLSFFEVSLHATRSVIRPNDGCFVGNGGSRILRFFPVNLFWWQQNILFCVFQVLGFLPLDWLSNENHVRCLIGLFTCDVLLGSNVFQVRTVISRCDWSGKFNSSS